jgi:hypothetical protein
VYSPFPQFLKFPPQIDDTVVNKFMGGINLSIVNLGGLSVTENSYRRARNIVENRTEGGRQSANDVLASLRQMMPGWNISTSSSNWGEGFRNIEIDSATLNRMAEDPEEMIRYKALILDLEDAVPVLEEWAQQNEGQSLEFGIFLDENGARAVGIMRALLGGEMRTYFELPNDRPAWPEIIRQKLEALREGQAQDADGTRSWLG